MLLAVLSVVVALLGFIKIVEELGQGKLGDFDE